MNYTGDVIAADFKTEPYLHQLKELEQYGMDNGRALLWQMRSGKSKTIVDSACMMFKAGMIDGVLIFAPNGVHENWLVREVPIHGWDTIEHRTLAWKSSVSGKLASKSGWSKIALQRWQHEHDQWWAPVKDMLKTRALTWWSFNSESMTRRDCRNLIKRIWGHRRLLIVFDESHNYRTPGSKRSKMAYSIAMKSPYRRILTGTPVTNSPLHAYSQFALLGGRDALGFDRYEDFKYHHAVYKMEKKRNGQQYPVLDRYKNLDELRDRIADWSSVILRSDCPDLPSLVRSERQLKMNDEQERLYRELKREFEVELAGQDVSIGENTNRLMKLQQVASGFLIDEFGDVFDIPGVNPRLEAISEDVYLTPGKAIVWCQFQKDIDEVANRLMADGHEIVQYHGRVAPEEKARVRALLAPDAPENDVKAVVGQPQSGGQGLDFSSCGAIFNYSHTFDAIIREQADERATAIGGENIPVKDYVVAPVDSYILENVLDKIHVADAVAGNGLRDALRSRL